MENNIHYKCLNDMFAYCKGTPQEGKSPVMYGVKLGNGCDLDPATCGLYLKESELDKEVKSNAG